MQRRLLRQEERFSRPLHFGPDPATHNHNTLGGMIGNNSCGTHSVMAGKTEENVIELDILTYDGLRMSVGATTDEDYQHIVSGGGRRAEIYARLKQIAKRYDFAPCNVQEFPLTGQYRTASRPEDHKPAPWCSYRHLAITALPNRSGISMTVSGFPIRKRSTAFFAPRSQLAMLL